MLLFGIVVLVFAAGCAGGLVNSLIAGEFKLPAVDKQANVFRPGWIGSCLVGGIAALTFWGLYGPFAEATVLGGFQAGPPLILKVGELFGSLVKGIGGGRLLVAEVDRHALKNQNAALTVTRNELADAVATLAAQVEVKS